MNTYQHQLRVSTDDSKVVAQTTIAALLDIMEDDDDPEDQAEQIAEIEEEFFNHCLVCHDRLAFSMVWWEMSKTNGILMTNGLKPKNILPNKPLNLIDKLATQR